MCKPLRLCLDLNIWCAALLADIKGNQNSACQSIVNFVRCGKYASRKIELVISWGMLNRFRNSFSRKSGYVNYSEFSRFSQ